MADEATTVAAHSDDNNMDGSMNNDNNGDDTSSPPRQKQRVTFEEECEDKRNKEKENEQEQHADGNNTKEELEQTQQPTVQLAAAQTQQQVAHHQHYSKKKPLSLGGVSKRAVLSSKRKIWDSNDASIDAAQSAVDHWENVYKAMRSLLIAGVRSAHGVYGAAKTGATGLEHGLLVPVRDWVLLPAFLGAEHAYRETARFVASPQAAQVAEGGLAHVRQFPYIGDTILAPAIWQSYHLTMRAWEIAQYPIPSKTAVRDSVDHVLTMTKWALSTAYSEVLFYMKRLDANVTRSLMHTQWKVLGSGPYGTLDKLHKVEVLDHLCERYLSLSLDVARYEFAAHIRAHNSLLYKDLVLSGLLRERGGILTQHNEWLAACPSYRKSSQQGGFDDGLPFFMPAADDMYRVQPKVVPLYFRLPYVNGRRPSRDAPWQRFSEPERRALEDRFQEVCLLRRHEEQYPSCLAAEGQQEQADESSSTYDSNDKRSYPTVANWYQPNMMEDVQVDQKRQVVSYFTCCPKCRRQHESPTVASSSTTTNTNDGGFCEDCLVHTKPEEAPLFPPAVMMRRRPTMWRFHGPGDEVRRAVWFLDTKRHGLQPYSDESAAILEDAYWFLRHHHHSNPTALLTIQVASPDGSEQQLVQFSSLYQVTAIQKTLGGAISLFKRRVYRGVSLEQAREAAAKEDDRSERQDRSFEEEENDELWEDCANEPPAIIVDEDDDTRFYFDGESGIPMIKEEEEKILHYGPYLALPATDLDLEDELSKAEENDSIDHLVLIVHGIGEMLRTTEFFGLNFTNLSSIVECCGYLRDNHAKVGKVQASLASVNGRVEYLPVEWHEAFALQSQREPAGAETSEVKSRNSSSTQTDMADISLRTIPQMRAFANDTLMDVLYFMSPEHHDLIIDIVTNEMNFVVQKFRDLTGFEGRISVIGHSLGSIITWDILDHQVATSEVHNPETYSPPVSSNDLHQLDHTPPRHNRSATNNNGPTSYPQLSFRVQNTFFLGSPVAVFLMIRNQHKPLNADFQLAGCRNVFNIFHPYDPVAYRIEPLIHRGNADLEPRIVTHWNGGFRVQYRTKRIWKKIVDETMRTQQHVIEVVEAHMTGLGLLDSSSDYIGEEGGEEDQFSDSSSAGDDYNAAPRRAVCGFLNQGRRIDYMLQEKEIESANEYVAALNAHSTYWIEKDLSLFVARQIVRSTLEAAIQDSEGDDYQPSDTYRQDSVDTN